MATELKQAIEAVLALQHQWTAVKTEAMDSRGELIRNTIPRLLRPLADERGHEAFGSSGAGSNNRVPWVRIFRPDVSPSPQAGWYVVLLFAADGSAIFLSLIQGTTEWEKGRGTQIHPGVLSERSEQARSLLRDSGLDLHDLDQTIQLHDPGLGKGYERGTAFALRYAADSIPEDGILLAGVSRMLDLAESVYVANLGEDSVQPTEELDDLAPAGTRTWIFQANPTIFDVTAAVAHLKTITWVVRRFKQQIHPGDRAYVWRSGPEAGIVATAIVPYCACASCA
jgi:hypothetical protein